MVQIDARRKIVSRIACAHYIATVVFFFTTVWYIDEYALEAAGEEELNELNELNVVLAMVKRTIMVILLLGIVIGAFIFKDHYDRNKGRKR